jgi:NADP-dependent 3-hydroxy acid dehydrogenase YdfG
MGDAELSTTQWWWGTFALVATAVFAAVLLIVPRAARRRQPEGERLCVVVTGAASGIGRGIVRELLRRATTRDPGLFVVGVDLADVAGISNDEGRFFWGCRADVTDPAAMQAVAAGIRERGLRCDALCAAAGLTVTGPLVEIDLRRIKTIMDVNVYGA